MIEQVIFSHLIENEVYSRKVLPFLKSEYFSEQKNKIIFDIISKYVIDYNKLPTKEIILSNLENLENISEDEYNGAKEVVKSLKADTSTSEEWLLDETEKFCQDQAVFNAIHDSIKIIENKDKKRTKGNIPLLLTEALGVSFDTNIGHDYIEDSDKRFDLYHTKFEHLPFDIDFFNTITKGGLIPKTLNMFLAPVGVGKTLVMCHCAASHLAQGKNVLYITMEMAEEKIAERIDANLMGVSLDDLATLPKSSWDKKIDRIKEKTQGKLIVKEFPNGSANAAHFRHLLQELRIKKKFIPDIIYIDYLNICSSFKMKMGGAVNSYLYVKSIAEEVRALAVEFKVPIVSSTQTNRSGWNNSDIEMDNTSESFGTPATVDLLLAIIETEDLVGLGQYMIKQIKNRYSDKNKNNKFVIGVDKDKMRLYNLDSSAQSNISQITSNKVTKPSTFDDKPVMDNSKFGERLSEEKKKKFSRLIME